MIFDDYQLITSEDQKPRTVKLENSKLEFLGNHNKGNLIWNAKSGSVRFRTIDAEYIHDLNSQIRIKSILKKVAPGYEHQTALRFIANCFLALVVVALLLFLKKYRQFELALFVSITYFSFIIYQRFRNKREENRNFWKKVRIAMTLFSNRLKEHFPEEVQVKVEANRYDIIFDFLSRKSHELKIFEDGALFRTQELD